MTEQEKFEVRIAEERTAIAQHWMERVAKEIGIPHSAVRFEIIIHYDDGCALEMACHPHQEEHRQ